MVNMIPREHGAWAMLITAFASAIVLARSWDPVILAAAGAALLAFLLREPLVVLGRQMLVWRHTHPDSPHARHWAAAEGALLALCGAWLLWRLPWAVLIPLGGAAVALTLIAVWMMVHNRRRSLWLQVASAAGLNSSALIAALAARGRIEPWAWALWALLTMHSAAGVLVVRERLDARVRARTGEPAAAGWGAAVHAAVVLFGAGLALLAHGRYFLAAATLMSSAVHLREWRGLREPAVLGTPLRQVGFRALVASLLYAVLVTAGLW